MLVPLLLILGLVVLMQAIIQYHNREELREKKAEIKLKRKEVVAGRFKLGAAQGVAAALNSQKEAAQAKAQARAQPPPPSSGGAPILAEADARRQPAAPRDGGAGAGVTVVPTSIVTVDGAAVNAVVSGSEEEAGASYQTSQSKDEEYLTPYPSRA